MRHLKLKKIEFVFQDYDTLSIDAEYVSAYQLSDIRKQKARVGVFGCFDEMDICNHFVCEINKEANENYYEFSLEKEKCFKTKFDRLLQKDITAIKLFYNIQDDDDAEEIVQKYYVRWVDDEECKNEMQSGFVSIHGHLYLAISKDANFWNSEKLNADDYNIAYDR